MKRITLILLGIFGTGLALAGNKTWDVYGVDAITRASIEASCQEDIERWLALQKDFFSHPEEANEKKVMYFRKIHDDLLAKINKNGDFSFVNLSTVFYADKDHTTIDIVKKEDDYRYPHHRVRIIKKGLENNSNLKDLLKLWRDYEGETMSLLQQQKLDFKTASCPVLHCVIGFSKEQEKTLLPKITEGVKKSAKSLMALIEQSDNEQDRGAAIFLLGNGKNYEEIAAFLTHYINDESSLVRNNAMRVLGAITSKYKLKEIPLDEVIAALDFPYETDRNKALSIVVGVVKNDKTTHQKVIKKSGETLIKLLELQQPNNHDLAYQILKEISGKNYKDNEIAAWKEWLKKVQTS